MSDKILNQLFRRTRKCCKSSDQDFPINAEEILHNLSNCTRTQEWAQTVGEIVPRLFARDINTGYNFFHNEEKMEQVWILYKDATKLIIENLNYPEWQGQKGSKCKVAIVTSVFWDDIAPSRAVCDFALNLDRTVYEPLIINTNQFFTHKRKIGAEVPGASNTNLGLKMTQNNIPVISLAPCESNTELARSLIRSCLENNVDMVVSNTSQFGFPDACLATSQVTGCFFDMHQGFPLYSSHVDAICHFIPETRKAQLSLWEKEGGKVVSYNFGMPFLETIPEKPNNGEKVYLITVSNHLSERLSTEFCQTIQDVLEQFDHVHYTLVGNGDPAKLKEKFPLHLQPRIECTGAIEDEAQITGWLVCSDIYVNEFPVGGGRAILEAMMLELPVIAMKSGESHVEKIAASFVGDDAIDHLNPTLYKSKLCSLIENKESRLQLGRKLRKRVKDVYDIRTTVKDLSNDLYKIYQNKAKSL
ncbi:MAG: glycosyltransferase [Lentisphaeraceae bacterium]|nr:glycosyltransferase [Lentisphaeraceae bacterium]